MALSQITSGRTIKRFGGATIINNKSTPTGISGIITRHQFVDAFFDPTGQVLKADFMMPSWGNGTGTSIGTTGIVFFDNDVIGMSLRSATIANRGLSTAYIGFNSTTPNIASGLQLASGESIRYDNVHVNEIWAITSTGFATIVAQGIPRYQE